MANTIISPNMNLPVPTVSQDPGPDWANNINACLFSIDSHDHMPGRGVPIASGSLNINADLPFNDNNATTVRSINFSAQGSPLSLPSDVGCVYVSGVDLYYNDENGNKIRITQGGSVTGSSGTITGLPSGTASASYSAGTFSFQSATNTPANMAIGPLIVGANIANPKTVTISPSTSQPSNYAVTLPLALPGATALINCDSAGNEAFVQPDNATFGLNSGVYKVLDGGIGPAQLASVNSAQADMGTFQLITSTSFIDVTNLSATITASGLRPIICTLISSTSNPADLATFKALSGDSGYLIILKDGTTMGGCFFGNADAESDLAFPASLTTIDPSPSGGSHTYRVQAKTLHGSGIQLNFLSLYVQEL